MFKDLYAEFWRPIPYQIKLLVLVGLATITVLYWGMFLAFLLDSAFIQEATLDIGLDIFFYGFLIVFVWDQFIPDWEKDWFVTATHLMLLRLRLTKSS